MSLILSCIMDSPSADRVIAFSVLWGRALGIPVRFVHLGDLPDTSRGRLEELIAAHTSEAQTLEVHHPGGGRIGDAICRLAEEAGATYVMMGALARERPVRDLVGSTARRVARRAPCSVVLVSTPWHGGAASSTQPRFVVGVDYTPASVALAENMLRIARASSPAPEICFAREFSGYDIPMRVSPNRPTVPLGSAVEKAAEESRLAEFVGRIDTTGLSNGAVTLPGRPGQEIARYAEDSHADLLGILAPGRPLGVLDRFLSHPIMLLLDRLPCSVLLFRHSEDTAR